MTNAHIHLFTMDHTPPIQLFYMVKDLLIALLRSSRWNIPIARVDRIRRVPRVVSILAPLI